MSAKAKFGWVLIILGTLMIVSPFYTLTGYFVTGSASAPQSPETPLQLQIIFAGSALALLGYFLAKPKPESPVTV